MFCIARWSTINVSSPIYHVRILVSCVKHLYVIFSVRFLLCVFFILSLVLYRTEDDLWHALIDSDYLKEKKLIDSDEWKEKILK